MRTVVHVLESNNRKIATIDLKNCVMIFGLILELKPNNIFTLVIDITDNVPVESGCRSQPDAFPGEDVTVCVCTGNFCNHAPLKLQLKYSLLTLILAVLAIK